MAIGPLTVSVNLGVPASQVDTQAAVDTLVAQVNLSNANIRVALQQVRAALVAASAPHTHIHDTANARSRPRAVLDSTQGATAVAAVDAAIAAIP